MYIVDTACISPQSTFTGEFLEQGHLVVHEGNQYVAVEPSYKSLIAPSALRRMAKALRMGVGAGATLLERHSKVDGIIIGTAHGGLDHCLHFLNQIVEYEESTLTPTNFVQSTANNIASQLSLLSKNTGYNSTHVHKGLAFEAALIEAQLLFEDRTCQSLLVGATEEISAYNFSIEEQAGLFKEPESTSSLSLLDSHTPGTVCGEGASMFMMQAQRSPEAFARLLEIETLHEPTFEEVKSMLEEVLKRRDYSASDIQAIIIGKNGDVRSDFWYHDLISSVLPDVSVIPYKHWTGDYPTSSSFALWLGCQLVKQSNLPSFLPKCTGPIVIYNHVNGAQHSIMLLDKV